jgi:hypothetical protein
MNNRFQEGFTIANFSLYAGGYMNSAIGNQSKNKLFLKGGAIVPSELELQTVNIFPA